MKRTILLLFCLLPALLLGQIQVGMGDLEGFWVQDRIIHEESSYIKIYRRCSFNQRGTVIRFKPNGEYQITYNKPYRPERCGTGLRRRPKGDEGYYKLDPVLKKIKMSSYSPIPVIAWSLLWLNESSFAIEQKRE